MTYRSLQYVILQQAQPSPLDEVISFGMSLMFMTVMVGLVRSLVMNTLLPETETLKRLPQIKTLGYRISGTPAQINAIKSLIDRTGLLKSSFAGLTVKFGKAEKYFRPDEKQIALYSSKDKTIYVPDNATEYDFYHELSHFLDDVSGQSIWRHAEADRFMRKYGKPHTPICAPPERLPQTEDKIGHRELFEKLEAMTQEQQADWARANGWGSTADSAYRSLFSSMLRIPLKKGETWRSRAGTHIEKYYATNTERQPQILVEGGELVPYEYRYLIGWISDPLPEYSLLALPAVVSEPERKIDSVMKQLKEGVESIQQSDQFRLFLSTMAKFHDYSIGNLILIMLQKPGATHVAGFTTWKDLGRWVKSGEKGIAIQAPVMPPAATCPKCEARLSRGCKFCPRCGAEVEISEEIVATPRYFKVVYVFDLSQTEGKPLPEFEVPSLTGEANEELFDKVLGLAAAQGLEVSFEPKPQQDPAIKGYYSGKLIWIRPEESRAQQFKTLIHEVAHYYSEGVFHIPRRDAETIAESAAFAVGAHFGFDSGVRSFPYVALWAQDKKVLEQNLAAIRKVTAQIIEDLER